MLENRMIIDDDIYIENDEYDNYLEHLYEEDDRRYDDEIFERMSD